MDNGAVLLTEASRKTVLTAYQERKREELRHAFIEEKAAIGLFPLSRRNCWPATCAVISMPIRHSFGNETWPHASFVAQGPLPPRSRFSSWDGPAMRNEVC